MTLPSAPRPPAWRILIVGGGIASLALALALRHGAGEAVEVTIADPAPETAAGGGRAYALSMASVAMLDVLGIWRTLEPGAQRIAGMRITDSRLADAVRPDYLHFGGRLDEPLGYLLEAAPIATALSDACAAAGVTCLRSPAGSMRTEGAGIVVELGGDEHRAALLVAADGARSRLREAAGLRWIGERYPQMGLVATIAHERDHGGIAVQHFLPAGPFAILPLAGPGRALPHRSSIVWTERADRARELLGAPDEAVAQALAERFGPDLGTIERETPLAGFPLGVGLARSFVAERMALLGDAAHLVHPLAGQGLNLGLGDAAALAERIVDAVRLGLDPGGPDVLAAYQRDRRLDAVAMATLTDGLNRLFSNDSLALRALRDLGLGLVDRSPAKRLFAAHAAGTTARAPRLMRGEAL
ncbi:FAD-dependent monooxygenase [Enterovirga rhinocerotis]|uniref:2-octaprenyl-6-methoxyphenol hydroxylase n=1 Tax=Enterovirga rhinocerotis TaxID=1339210 RepID=A0A4R7BNC4_9HYPH|nr:FAD-dependent monooxygenase [Enterovirga rhinocerotis]TDR85427.1 2-octaprenyl-6-methoxyphenol hydroxylase [Enterovirga rhinocerotis]